MDPVTRPSGRFASPFSPELLPALRPGARWIWPEGEVWDLTNGYAQFRKVVVLPRRPRRAPVLITADQSYRLWVNGELVSRGPARGFQEHWPCDELDLAPWLRRGRNVIAVRAHHPGRGNFQYVTRDAAGFLFSARWCGIDVVSDKSWKMRREPGVRKDSTPCGLPLFPQEHLDARLSEPGWQAPDYDDSAWRVDYAVEKIPGGAPWPSLEPRGIPALRETLFPVTNLIGVARNKSAPGFREARDVFLLRLDEPREHTPVVATKTKSGSGADAPATRVAPAAGADGHVAWLFDLGHVEVGCVRLRVSGASGGEIVDALYFETVDPVTLAPDIENPSWCRIALGQRLICRAGETVHEFYHPCAGRYLNIIARGHTRPLKITVEFRRVGYPLRDKGAFSSSDPLLEKIWAACAWTQRICSLDGYVDTPWREQAQWWGDARVQAANTFHLDGDTRLFRRGLHCIAHQVNAEGLTYGHAPTVAHSCILPDFALIWMITLWDYHWQTGSLEPFHTHRKVVQSILDYFVRQTDSETGLVRYDPRFWLFLDWCELPKEGCPAVLSLWYLDALQKMIELHRLSGATGEVKKLEKRAAVLRKDLRKLIRPDGMVVDGYDERGRLRAGVSVHAQTLAIMIGLDPRNDAVRVRDVLVPWIRDQFAGPGDARRPSSYWATYPLAELTRLGHGAEALAYIRRHWAGMAEYGSTWENFEPVRGAWSHSHAWSAHPLFHLMAIVGGLTQTGVAWTRARFAPVFEGEHGGARIPTPLGALESRWRRRADGRVDVSLRVPKGMAVQVVLPGENREVGPGRHRWMVA